ncbi:MAG: UvrD-helicase domain-containing protein [Stackebrandtia sp.]
MPEPLLPTRREPPRHDGPCLAGMEEVGTGLLDHVDAMQRVAASAPPGQLLINAGPGTGKTHVLVRRVAYHITELHIPASQCLVLAAAPAAAEDLRRQLEALVGDGVAEATIGAFCDYQPENLPPLGHLFVDDLHHMTPPMYEALRADRGDHPAFTATGDPDSAVSGAATAFARFPDDYPDARVVRLSRNHRSTAAVVTAAMQLITPVTRTPGRTMLPARAAEETSPIGRFHAASDDDELKFLAELPDRLSGYGVSADDIAVLRADDAPPIDSAKVESMTVSQAAGRQFRVVCCAGVTPAAFPDASASARRALFHAMTRARDLLYVSHSAAGSPLLDDIDPGLFTAFGRVAISRPMVEQPRLL